MPVTLGAKPEHDFDQPIGLLSDCHRRIERFLDILLKVTTAGRGAALTSEQRTALETALRYFVVAAPKHTADEEQSLFPRLRADTDPRAHAALARMATLEADHRQADEGHAEVDRLGRLWLEKNELSQEDSGRLFDQLTALKTLYAHHIEMEEKEVFPVAKEVLEGPAIREIGREMAERRGLKAD